MENKQKLLKAIETYKSLKDNGIVKEYQEALNIVLHPEDYDDAFARKREIIKETPNYKLVLCLPYKEIMWDGGIRQHSYDGKIEYDEICCIYLCLSLCNYSREEIIKRLEDRVEELKKEMNWNE